MRKRRIELSGTYVVASALATVTGAIIASFFGVYGTLVGTALASVASTTGAALYQATLTRGKEQLRDIRPVVVSAARGAYRTSAHGARRGGPATTTLSYQHPGGAGAGDGTGDGDSTGDTGRYAVDYQDTAGTPNGGFGPGGGEMAGRQGSAPGGEDGTAVAGGEQGSGAPGGEDGTAVAGGEQGSGAPGGEDSAVLAGDEGDQVRAAEETAVHPAGPGGDGAGAPGGGGSGAAPGPDGATVPSLVSVAGRDASLWSKIGWKRVAVLAASVFVVAVGIITAIEALAGKPLNAVVRGGHGSGTSVSNLFSGQPAASPTTARPSPSPSRPTSTAPATAQSAQPSSTVPNSSSGRTAAPSPTPTAPTTQPGSGPPPSIPIPRGGAPTPGAAGSGSAGGQQGAAGLPPSP